jgi:hypothetical protein
MYRISLFSGLLSSLLLVLLTVCSRRVDGQAPVKCLRAAKFFPFTQPQYVDTIANFSKEALRFRSLCSINVTTDDSYSVWYVWYPPTDENFLQTQLIDVSAAFVNDTKTSTSVSTSPPIRITIFEKGMTVVNNAKSPILQFRANNFTSPFGTYNYYFKVTAPLLPRALTLTVTMPPPPNDRIEGAIILDPLAGATVNGTITNARSFGNPNFLCSAFSSNYFSPSVFYQFNNVLPVPILADVATMKSEMNVIVYRQKTDQVVTEKFGSCGNAKLRFLASANTTYLIQIHNAYGRGGNQDFELTLNGSPNYFNLIDPVRKTNLGFIDGSVSYGSGLSRLNIQAYFNDNVTKSVWMTFDKPRRSFCESRAPYSVFGDIKGDYLNSTIPVGTHVVTATPYATSNCTGRAGKTISDTFDVLGCAVIFYVYSVYNNSSSYCNRITVDPYYSNVIPSSNINIESVTFPCRFRIAAVLFEIRDVKSKKVILTTTQKRGAPYYLFGRNGTVPYSGSIPPGNYTIQVTVDGIQHAPMPFRAIDDNDACFKR